MSLFSGWEPNEFTLQLLRRRHGHKHFGVHLRENRVTGYLSPSLEEEIARQWDQVRKILPSFPDIKFRDRINEVKELDWYKGEVTERERTLEGCAIARYGEEDAEGFFLAFSALCLHLATSEESSHVTNRLLHASLSILLPVSQFCVDDRLWDSDIGEAATSLSSFDEWKLLNRMGVDAVMDSLDKDKPKRRRKSDKVIERKVQEWIKGTDKRTLKSFVSLPVKELRRLWFQGAEELTTDAKDASRQCMEKVHMATKKLRGCYTEMATERASLNVSVALLELASSPGCFDPFLCLQQAAMFASQACKAGNSDTSYRAGLPEKTECTPLQALVILGRADCLHSVRFPNEAAFLCSYVAKVCRLHRDNEGTEDAELEWNARWKIVAISAYNTSVMIRTTVSSVLEKQQQNSFLSMWERDVVEELERGRTDGWVWKRSLYNGGDGVILPPDLNDLDDFEADEEDYNSIDDDDDDDESENGDHDDDDVPDSDYQKLEAVPRSMDEHLAMLTLPYDASLIPMNVHEFAEVAVVQKGEDEEDNDNDNGFEGITMVSV